MKKRRKNKKIVIFCLLILFLFIGQSSFIFAKKANTKKIPQFNEQEIKNILFSKPQGIKNIYILPDPFRPFIFREVKKQERTKKLSPLQELNIDQLKLVGIIQEGNKKIAILQDNTGKGYFVKVGTKIGENGTITRIDANCLEIKEKFINFLGEKEEKKIILKLRAGD